MFSFHIFLRYISFYLYMPLLNIRLACMYKFNYEVYICNNVIKND